MKVISECPAGKHSTRTSAFRLAIVTIATASAGAVTQHTSLVPSTDPFQRVHTSAHWLQIFAVEVVCLLKQDTATSRQSSG